MGKKLPRILPKVATSTSLLGSFTCRKLYDMGKTALLPLRRKAIEVFSLNYIKIFHNPNHVSQVKVPRDRPRWPKGFQIG